MALADVAYQAKRWLVRRSGKRRLQPAGGFAVPGKPRKTLARGSPLRSCDRARLQYPSLPQESRQRDFSALRAARFRADRGLRRASPGRSTKTAAAPCEKCTADDPVRRSFTAL